MVTTIRRTITAAVIGTAALVAVVLVSLNSEGQEVSHASGFLPCWLTGESCDLPKEDAVKRWGGHKKEEEYHWESATGLFGSEAPCQLGGDCDGLPSKERVNRWKRDGEEQEAQQLRTAQGIAKRNSLAVPQKNPSHKDEHDLVTPDTLQQNLQQTIVVKAIARAKAIAAQVRGRPVANYDAQLGKGLFAHGEKDTALLTKHPNSQKHINKIIAEVQKAEEAQAAAKKAQAEAIRLKLEAEQAQQDAKGQTKQAAAALSQAKAMEAKHKTAVQEVELSKDQLRYAAKKASEAETKIGIKKTSKAKPKLKQSEELVADPWETMADEYAPMDTVVPAVQREETRAVSGDSDGLMKQYAESRQKYAAAKEETASQAEQLRAALSGVEGSPGGVVPEGA